ncbi:hypoxanthine phosphoribosyltransferase [Gammaproteobacteria bacterium]
MNHIINEVFANADTLYSIVAVEAALNRLAADITMRLADRNPLILCVLTGGIIPVGQLLPRLTFPLQLDYIHATRYANQTSGGELTWVARPTTSLAGRVVLVVDDILDEGITLAAILNDCQSAGASEVLSAVLVRKDRPRQINLVPDFVGLEIPDYYVFGYGMDYHGYWRNAAGIYAVKGL